MRFEAEKFLVSGSWKETKNNLNRLKDRLELSNFANDWPVLLASVDQCGRRILIEDGETFALYLN